MGLSAGAQISLSAALLLLGFALLGRSPGRRGYTGAVLLLAFVSLLLAAAHFASDYFTAEGVNEAVIYHLRYGLDGAGLGEYAGLIAAVTLALALCVAALWAIARRRRVRPGSALAALGNPAAVACLALSAAMQPAGSALLQMQTAATAGWADAQGPGAHALQAEFERHYRSPRATAREAPRNLVFIYVEGLERNYFDETLFPGLITDLRRLEHGAVSFLGIGQVAGTEWTIAGMVASQCAIPLLAPTDGNAMGGMDAFLPGATCLGDLLKSEGYRLAYYGGANLHFAGKGKFYATHGFDEIAGRSELRPRLPDAQYVNAWGLYDDSLFELAYEKYAELARARRPFALLLLTLDTHHPNGHVSRSCASVPYGDGANPMLNAVRCADRLVGGFVERIRGSPWGRDTVIVVASDHLAMRNAAYERLTRKLRSNLFMVLDPRRAAGGRIETPGSMLDVAPTVMSFLGFDAEIGLGIDLMRADEAARARAARVRARLEGWRGPLTRFWGFPRIERYLEVDAERRALRIDGRTFRVPSLLEVDADLQTVMRFPGTNAAADKVVREAQGRPFLLVAPCATRDRRLPPESTCLFAGRDDHIRTQFIVRRSARFAPHELLRMIGPAS